MTTSYDAIVIGAGQAGPFLAVKLAHAGMKTALIEALICSVVALISPS